jgi:hypothetical protein
MDQGEVLHLVRKGELAQSLKHQVSNANATKFPLLHRVIGSFELGALISLGSTATFL